MTIQVPPKSKSITLVFVSKVQSQTQIFSIVQRILSTRQLRPLLLVPIGGTILMTLETALRLQLVEQGVSTLNSIRPCNPSLYLSSELLHDHIDIEGFYTRWARSDSARPQSLSLRQSGTSLENQLSEENYLSISRSVVDEYEHELVSSVPNTDSFDEGERQQQEMEADEAADEAADGNNDEDDSHARQEVNSMATTLAAEGVSDTHLSSKEDGSPRPAERQQLLPSRDPSSETSHDDAGSYNDTHSNDELHNNADSDDDNRRLRPAKRKRSSSSYDSPIFKKRRCHLQQRSTGQRRLRFKSRRRSPKSYPLLD